MDIKIERFLIKEHILTLATSQNNLPWCANLFYAYDKTAKRLIFTSNPNTKHIEQALLNPTVACSITHNTKTIAKIKGAQIIGKLSITNNPECRNIFLKKFPIATLKLDQMWQIEIQEIKYTDNSLSFSTKLYYSSKNDAQ